MIKRIGDCAVILPFGLFALTTGIAAMGAPLAGLVMMPIAMPLAKMYDIDRALMGLSVGRGICAAGYAPTSLFGIVTYGTAHSMGIPLNLMILFAIALGVNILLLIAAFFMFGGSRLLRNSSRFDSIAALHVDLESVPLLPGHPFEQQKYSAWSKTAAETQRSGVMVEKSVETSKMSGIQIVTVVCMLGLIANVITLVDSRTGCNAVSKID